MKMDKTSFNYLFIVQTNDSMEWNSTELVIPSVVS